MIGGGFIGCEITASLTMIGVQVTQIVRDPMLFATIDCPPLSESLHETYRAHGVDLRLEESDIPDADSWSPGSASSRTSSLRVTPAST